MLQNHLKYSQSCSPLLHYRFAYRANSCGNVIAKPLAFYCSPLLCYRFVSTTLTAQIPNGNAIAKPQALLHTGKERDSEIGLSYFGARYYDSDILTGWLSVDPMADKYPSLSPYAYCGWNPVRLVDPDGEDIVIVIWATTPNNENVGHAGIAVSNYKEENGKMIPDGTFTYYDNWPNENINFDLKGAITSVDSERGNELINSIDVFKTKFHDYEETSPDGVLVLSTSYEQDMSIKKQLENANKNKDYYNGAFYNCSTYVSDGLSALFGKKVGKETVVWPFQSVTPNQLWKDVREVAGKQGIINNVLVNPGILINFSFRESIK